MVQPSPEVQRQRNTVQVGKERVDNVTSKQYPGHYPGEDFSWNIDTFRENFNVYFHRNSPTDAVFSLVGLDASLANAFRRILLVEIPMLAIEDVFITQNTSIVQDEVLAHRLGLVPLTGSLRGLRWLRWRSPHLNVQGNHVSRDCDTIQIHLHVKCAWREGGQQLSKNGENDPQKLYENAHVYASHLGFRPIGQQEKLFSAESGPVRPVNPNILLAKMRPDQEIELVMHAVKGVGADHAKFSHVATASYRLLPTIDITQPILNADARKFAACFPPGVIGLEKDSRGKQDTRAVVRNPIADTVSRECLRYPEFAEKVKLGRKRDHFIFSVESVGQMDSDHLFIDSVKILRQKCVRLRRCLSELREGE